MKNPSHVDYPNKGLLSHSTPGLNYQVSAQGRNGYMKQIGLEIFRSPAGVLRLSPINSKGVCGNCCIEIPDNPEVVAQVTAALVSHEGQSSDQARAERHRGDWEYDDARYCRDDWQSEVACRDTQLGYIDWVKHKYQAEEESGS